MGIVSGSEGRRRQLVLEPVVLMIGASARRIKSSYFKQLHFSSFSGAHTEHPRWSAGVARGDPGHPSVATRNAWLD